MSLPIYQHIHVRSSSLDDLGAILHAEMNFKHPVVINLKLLDIDQQREFIGLIENFFVSHNISYKFPYPVYIMTEHETTISKMPTVKNTENLPAFFAQRESKMNVKESHIISKNHLLQQELNNTDSIGTQNNINLYGSYHKKIYDLERERNFYLEVFNRLTKAKK